MVRQNKPARQKLYRLSLLENSTHRSIKSIRFTKARAVASIAGALILLVLFIYCLIAFTPLRTAIPGYPNAHSRKTAIENAIKIDSLENAMLRWNLYATNLSRILAGEATVDFDSLLRQARDVRYLSQKSEEELRSRDSLLRETVINEERFGVGDAGTRSLPVEGMHFYVPLKGVTARGFNSADHPGIDITAQAGTIVSATLGGSVVYTAFDPTKGQVVIIQHHDDLVSIYSNNSEALVSVGQAVKAGDPVAIVGSRPGAPDREYLHFELWHNGHPLDPSEYINF